MSGRPHDRNDYNKRWRDGRDTHSTKRQRHDDRSRYEERGGRYGSRHEEQRAPQPNGASVYSTVMVSAGTDSLSSYEYHARLLSSYVQSLTASGEEGAELRAVAVEEERGYLLTGLRQKYTEECKARLGIEQPKESFNRWLAERATAYILQSRQHDATAVRFAC